MDVDHQARVLEFTTQPLVLSTQLRKLGGVEIALRPAAPRLTGQRAGGALLAERVEMRGVQALAPQDRRDATGGRSVGFGEDPELVFDAEAPALRALWNLRIGHG